MDYQSLYDILFAVRLSSIDSYDDELRIIKDLKLYILDNDLVPEDDINDLLYNFYCSYEIDITLDDIASISIAPSPSEVLGQSIFNIIPLNFSNLGNNIDYENEANGINTHENIINTLNALINGPALQIDDLEDVIVTLDNNELDSLKTIRLENKLDTDCCICMEELTKYDIVTELKCQHTFHADCIKTYLSQYNYKCPVCRTELGAVKYNI